MNRLAIWLVSPPLGYDTNPPPSLAKQNRENGALFLCFLFMPSLTRSVTFELENNWFIYTVPPLRGLQYDRSGRSTGTAWIHFINPSDAALAKARLNGISAKGTRTFLLSPHLLPHILLFLSGLTTMTSGLFFFSGQPMKIEIEAARPPRDVLAGPRGARGKLISRIGSLPLLDRMQRSVQSS